MARWLSTVAVLLALPGGACNSTTTTNASCDYRPTRNQCSDFAGLTTVGPLSPPTRGDTGAVLDSACSAGGGRAVNVCDRAGSLGGCRGETAVPNAVGTSDTGVQTTWFYANSMITTTADVASICGTTSGTTYVSP